MFYFPFYFPHMQGPMYAGPLDSHPGNPETSASLILVQVYICYQTGLHTQSGIGSGSGAVTYHSITISPCFLLIQKETN